jgi:hypothetical protein
MFTNIRIKVNQSDEDCMKIKALGYQLSKWIKVYQSISRYIKVDKGGRGEPSLGITPEPIKQIARPPALFFDRWRLFNQCLRLAQKNARKKPIVPETRRAITFLQPSGEFGFHRFAAGLQF